MADVLVGAGAFFRRATAHFETLTHRRVLRALLVAVSRPSVWRMVAVPKEESRWAHGISMRRRLKGPEVGDRHMPCARPM